MKANHTPAETSTAAPDDLIDRLRRLASGLRSSAVKDQSKSYTCKPRRDAPFYEGTAVTKAWCADAILAALDEGADFEPIGDA